MPVPTDTFWNIKRLNWAFAISGLLLLLTIVVSVLQDYKKHWRDVQVSGRAWEAALTEQRIRRVLSPNEEEKLNDLKGFVARLDQQLASGRVDFDALAAEAERLEKKHAPRNVLTVAERENLQGIQAALRDPVRQQRLRQFPQLTGEINAIDSEIQTRTFTFNNRKAEVTVAENDLQAAITARDNEQIHTLQRKLESQYGRDWVAKEAEELAKLKKQLTDKKLERGEGTKEIDDLRKLTSKLSADVELMRKKLSSLRPDNPLAKFSSHIRQAPLMGFINPSEKVRQQVLPDILTDVSFMKITTIDRCTTCHVHIDRREFTETNVLTYLEEQLATARGVRFLPAAQPGDPTDEAPGALGMPEFWHAWAVRVAPSVLIKNAASLQSVADTVGRDKQLTVTLDRRPVDAFTYDVREQDPAKRQQQDLIMGELLKAWLTYERPADPKQKEAGRSQGKRVTVVIGATVDAAMADAAKQAASTYPVLARDGVRARLSPNDFNELEERYRHALVAEVNVHRDDNGYEPLDPSPALLAHPRLDLYADVDSPHAVERVGCTSCHDGSGQETNFVLAAHSPRAVWVDSRTGVPVLPDQIILTTANGNGGGHDAHHAPDMSSMLETVTSGDVSDLHFDHLAPANAADHHDVEHPTTRPAAAKHVKLQAPKPTPGAHPVSYVDPLTGETRKAVSQADYWKKYELESGTSFKDVYHYWDWPIRPREFVEANCARCHSSIHDIKEFAPTLYEGRSLFLKMGCVNCHQMDSIAPHELQFTDDKGELVKRRAGPDLRHVNEKLSTAFLHSWIWAPKSFRPSTPMPHFFMLENNASDEELRRTQQEVRAITFYLQKTASAMDTSPILADPSNAMPQVKEDEAEVTARVERGRRIFIGLEGVRDPVAEMQGGVGCIACHTNLNETGLQWISQDMIRDGALAAELTERLGKAPTNKQLSDEARKRYEAMSYNERQLYAWERFGERTATKELPEYPDGSNRPIFQLHGPELSAVGTKLLAGRTKEQARKWLYEWLIDPRHYSAYSNMPRLRLTPDEALDLTEYLLAQQRTSRKKDDAWQAVEIAPDPAKVRDLVAMFLRSQYTDTVARQKAAEDAEMHKRAALVLQNRFTDKAKAEELAKQMSIEERQLAFLGQKLITHYGCMNCHAINGVETAASPCANLSDWGQKAITKLDFAFLDHHKVEELSEHEASATSRIPMVNALSPEAVTKVTAHLNARNHADPISAPVAVAWPHVDHTRTAWLDQKLRNSRIYDRGKNLLEPKRRTMQDGKAIPDDQGNPIIEEQGKPYDKLRMPTFYLTDEQVHALVTFVISNRDKLISPRLLAQVNDEEAQRIAHGRQIVERYNCVGCHHIDANQPAIQQYWLLNWYGAEARTEIVSKAPPTLRSQGARVQHDWLYTFLQNVPEEGSFPRGKIRPLPYIRMPSFPLTDEETTAIAAYFNAVSVKEAKTLAKKIEPLIKVAAPKAPTTQPVPNQQVWPDELWWKEPQLAPLAAYLKSWALENTPAKPIDFAATDDESLSKAYQTALYDARFTAELFDAPYPFVEQSRPTISDERFNKGQQFFHFLQCHTCHIVSNNDQTPGVNQVAKGPNLNLTHRRLQRHWVRHWVQDTQVIQVGSLMPPYFSGRNIPSLTDEGRSVFHTLGLPYIPSPATPDGVRAIQAEYGQTVEDQANLLLDYIYAAGLRGHTAIDPPQGQEPKVPTTLPANVQTAPIPGITVPLPKKEAPKKDDAPAPPDQPPPQIASGEIIGKVILANPPKTTGTRLADPQCAKHHPNGVLPDDTFAVAPDGGLHYVVVSISKGLPPGRYPAIKEPAVLDQKGCRYEPHVLPMMVGQPVVVKNSDPFLHNVHGLPQINPTFNFGQNNIDPGKAIGSMKAREQFRVKCDVHPWMNCQFLVFDHPFFAPTKPDGTYSIKGLPPGTYTVTTWHEKCPPVEQTVTVAADKPAEANFTLKAEGE